MYKSLIQKILQNFSKRSYSYKSVRRPDQLTDRKPASAAQVKRQAEQLSNLPKQIQAKIMVTGPITVADYMREVLTNPTAGYYMHRDVFGRDGDFITSPEISQIFGELVAIWLINEWQKIGGPATFQLVELGPGRGTLVRDVLKVLSQFKLGAAYSIHLVEISPHLSQIQAQRLCFEFSAVDDDSLPYYQMGKTGSGIDVFWYRQLEDVPKEFSLVLAHEFFDALPVHKLQMEDGVWKEILVDVKKDSKAADGEPEFRFVLSKAPTPISSLYQALPGETRTSLEYSLETERLITLLAKRLEHYGGIGLIMDYGHFGTKSDTFRAFKRHQLHDPLKDPGSADLTADVDFKQLKHFAERNNEVICFGPVDQGAYLNKMEGEARLKQLLKNALPENQAAIKSGYKMLTDSKEMGTRFKFFAMFPAILKEHLEKCGVHGFN